MAGYREFQTGEVLTAANVNDFLMKQSTMVFVDAAARTAALDGAEAEGMLTYNEDTARLEVYDGSAFVPAAADAAAGIGSNVVHIMTTAVFSTSITIGSSAVYTDFEVKITPTADDSKVLVSGVITGGNVTDNAAQNWHITLRRDGTAIAIGDADGTRRRATSSTMGNNRSGSAISFEVLDSPNTTAEVTYSILLSHSVGATSTVVINRGAEDANGTDRARTVSTMTAIEVAA